MSTGLAGFRDGTPERFVPGLMSDQLVEVEHLSRYWWAARFAADRVVLDAGCGVGYGSEALASAGARRVVGVDVAKEMLEAVADRMPETVELRRADVRELPFENDTFGLVTCFEVIEHVEERDRVLDELARVAAADALVLVSSPNRDVYVPGNPHHVHEYLPEELREALARRFRHVTLVRQHSAAASFLLTDDQLAATGPQALPVPAVDKAMELKPGGEVYTVAVASDAPLPELSSSVCLTSPVEVRDWVERFRAQDRMLADQADALREMDALTTQRRRVADELLEAERRLARLPDLEEELAELQRALAQLESDRDALADEHTRAENDLALDLARAHATLDAIAASVSWRLTRPLRTFKRLLRG